MWNGGGGRRYSSDDDDEQPPRQISRRVIEDQLQMDAVSALASFSQASYAAHHHSAAATALGASSSDNGGGHRPYPMPSAAASATSYHSLPGSLMGRQYSDATNSQISATSSEYGARQQQYRSEGREPARAPPRSQPPPPPYYRNEDDGVSNSRRAPGGSYHHAATTTASGTYRGGGDDYHRAPPLPVYQEDYHHQHPQPSTTAMMRGEFHLPQAEHYDDDEPSARAVNVGPTVAAAGYHRALASSSSGPMSATYPPRSRHEDLASSGAAAAAAPIARGGPTKHGRPLLPPSSSSSYREDVTAPPGPRLPSTSSYRTYEEQHQGRRDPEARGMPPYGAPSSSRFHDDPDDPYGDLPYRRPSAASSEQHEHHHPNALGAPSLALPRGQKPRFKNKGPVVDKDATTGQSYRRPTQPTIMMPYHHHHHHQQHRSTAEAAAESALDEVVPTYRRPVLLAAHPPHDPPPPPSETQASSEQDGAVVEAAPHRNSIHHRPYPSGPPPPPSKHEFGEAQEGSGGIRQPPRPPHPPINGRANDGLLSLPTQKLPLPIANDHRNDKSGGISASGYHRRGREDGGDAHRRTTTQPEHVLYERSVLEAQEETEEEGNDSEDDAEEYDDYDEDDEGLAAGALQVQAPVLPPARGKPEAAARALAAARLDAEQEEEEEARKKEKAAAAAAAADLPKKKSSKKPLSPKKPAIKKPTIRKKPSLPTSPPSSRPTASTARREFLLGETVPAINEAEHENLKELMTQFCRIPLLSEFSRPVSILHPEVTATYSKIISHPVDLGHVCRGIRRRQYKNCRDIRLDMWRVFANCVKYNSHPSNKDAVPSFVSIALHLREYFNNLWQEYMLPSDPPRQHAMTDDDDDVAAHEVLKASIAKRDEERTKRLENSGVLVLSKTFTTKASSLLLEFIENGGCVDGLDMEPLFGPGSGVDDREVDLVIQRLGQYHAQLQEVAESGSIEYTLDAFHADLSKCYTEHVLEDNPAMRNRFRCRLDRFFWKQAVPLHEANSRGVTQSSIWGNLAATIWARESSKKPYWPALCLGILPPAEQREGWHQAVTERNEGRLPEKLRGQLMIAKKRCEQAQKRQSLSYFLVEFLGTHEFIWVRETDIIENFDPNTDPNKSVSVSKKARSSRINASNVAGSKTYATALQECVWASEEYENVLQDAIENSGADDSDEDDEEMNYSFQVLAQSDEEADDEGKHGYHYDEDTIGMSDVEEANYLIAHDGMLDTSAAGRKNAKKRSQALKKKISTKKEAPPKKDEPPKKKQRSKSKDKKETKEKAKETEKVKDPKEKERQEKKDQRELDKRRKKRLREHEKSVRNEVRKKTKRRRPAPSEPDDGERGLNHNKRARATAIVKAYLMRTAKQDDCKSLALSGVMTMPAALVDSTGLLGMALAFRAASGELSMPDDGKEPLAKLKPWDAIDTQKPKTSAERTESLQQQIKLLEKEIGRVRNNTEKRKFLAMEYVSKRLLAESVVEADELAARYNPFKKKKKPIPSKTDRSRDESPDKSETAAKEKPLEEDGIGETKADDDATEQADDHSDAGSDLGDSVDVSPNGNHDPGFDDRPEEDVTESMEVDSL